MEVIKKHPSKVFLILILTIFGCKKEIDISIPEINNTPYNAGVLDTITSIVYAQATIDNEPVNISYTWIIKNSEGNEIIPVYQDNDTIKWIPTKQGDYIVSVKGISDNKSVTKQSFLTINNTIKTFQTALQGEWEGTCEAKFFDSGPRIVHFSIESNGHYSAYMVSHPENTVLDNGIDIEHPEKMFIVKDILNSGEAIGEITFFHSEDNGILIYHFDKMKFSDDYNELSFNSGHFNPKNLNIKYSLSKQISNPAPSIKDISPNSAGIGDVTPSINITGKNTSWTKKDTKIDYVSLVKNNDTIPGSNLDIVNDNLITAKFNIPVSAVVGCYDVLIHDVKGDILNINCVFNITDIPDDSSSASIESVSPNLASAGDVTPSITIIGKNTSWNTGAGIYYVALTKDNDTIRGINLDIRNNSAITAKFNIPDSAIGCYNVITYDLASDFLTFNCGIIIE